MRAAAVALVPGPDLAVEVVEDSVTVDHDRQSAGRCRLGAHHAISMLEVPGGRFHLHYVGHDDPHGGGWKAMQFPSSTPPESLLASVALIEISQSEEERRRIFEIR